MSQSTLKIWIDADACPRPVKEFVYKTSFRLSIPVFLVANSQMHIPLASHIQLIRVADGADCADNYIYEAVEPGDIVITADIPLAARIVAKGAVGINPRGEIYTEDNVQECLSMRDFMQTLRSDEGFITGGPTPYSAKDKTSFANALNRLIDQLVRV